MEDKSFKEKHGGYFSTIWTISLWLGGVSAFINWIMQLFNQAQHNNVLGFLVTLALQTIIMGIGTFIGGAILFVLITVISFVPYLVIRGFSK